MHENQMQQRGCFLTLTYDDKHLPSDHSIDVEHWKLFCKTMRNKLKKLYPDTPSKRIFRYFHCGEYGDKTQRPHYHAAIFGQDFADTRVFYKLNDTGDQLYYSKPLNEMWGHGFVTIGNLNFKSAAYVARYIMKKVTGDNAEQHYQGRKPEYITMSRRPGIGSTWFEKFRTDVYPSDEVIVNGQQARPPKFYDTRLEDTDPQLLAELKEARVKTAAKYKPNNTPERLAIRKAVSIARMSQYKRDRH